MIAGRELVFLHDHCYLSAPGRIFDADKLMPTDLVEIVSGQVGGAGHNDIERILAARSRGTYLDYSAVDALDIDRKLMAEYLQRDPVPLAEPAINGALIWLPHPAFPSVVGALAKVAELLLAGFAVLCDADFLGLFEVAIKAPPSKGSRHPFNAYLFVGPGESFPAGVFSYVASKHALAAVPDMQSEAEGIVIVVTVVFERVQWRYRETSGYCDTLLDLGHMLQTVQTAAAELALSLQPVRFPGGAIDIPLVEEVAVAWRVGALSDTSG